MTVLLVDYDNTLNDTDLIFAEKFDGLFHMEGKEVWRIFLREIHQGIIEKQYPKLHDNIEIHMKLLFQYLNIDRTHSLEQAFIKKYYLAEQETWSHPLFYPDALPFLKESHHLGYTLCLTTGPHATKKAQAVERKLGTTIFDHVFGEDILGVTKTNPQYFTLVLEKTNSPPSDTICIGDTLTHDVKPSSTLGIKTIWVNRTKEPPTKLITPDLEVHDLTQALKALRTHMHLQT